MQPLRRWSWRSTGAIICDHCLPRYLPYVARLIDEYAVQSLDERVLAEACEFGASLSDLDAVLSRTTPNWKEVVKAATKGGHLHVFRWMRERQDDRGPWKADFDLATKEAARYGHLKLLKWLHERGLSCASFTVEFEALGYHLAAAKWQLLKGATLTGSDHERSVEQAAQNGLLATVEWIEMTFRCAGTSHAMEGAARKGDLDMLRWLHQQKSCSEACSTKAMDAAVRRGHLHVVEWLFENCSKGCSRSAVCEAARAGNLQMLQWLHKDCSDRFDPHVMDIVASEGHLELVKWLQQHRSEGCTLYAVSDAASNGHLDVLRWLHDNRTEGWTTYVMDVAAIGGHLHVVKWLHENRAEGCTEIGLDYAAQNGHVDVLWWLLEHYLDKCGDDLMEIAALAGHLDVVQYLDKKLNYRASDWGLGAAAKQGWMKTLLVLMQHYYHDDRAVGSYGLDAVCKAFDEMLTQLSCQQTTPGSLLWGEALGSLELFHGHGYYSCVSLMLERALRRGYLTLVQRFMGHRDANEMCNYVAVAAKRWNPAVLRWLLEIGIPIDKPSAIKLATKYYSPQYVEVAGYPTGLSLFVKP